MAEVASAYVSLLPSAKGFGSKLESEVGGEVKSSGSKLGKTFGKMFAVGGGLLAAAGVGTILSGSIDEAREAQKVGALTESIIKSTGGAAKITAVEVGNLSSSLSAKIGVDDELIQSGANLLLTFKNVRNEVGEGNKVFNRATKAAADLSAAGFGDLEGQAKMLGKALNDPVKGMTALTRSGVTFSAEQTNMVKKLVESGQMLKAQKIILGEVESQVGGAAAATATAGDKAAVALGNLKEQAGTALLPVIDSLANTFTTKLAPGISSFITGMQTGTGVGGQFAAVLVTAKNALVGTVSFVNQNRTAFAALATVIAAVVTITKIHATVMAVQAAGGLLAMAKATKVAAAGQWLLNAALTANPIGIVVVGLVALGAALVVAYKKSQTFRKIVDTAFKAVVTAGAAVVGFFTKQIPAAFNAVKNAAASALGWVKSNWPTILAILTGPFGLAILQMNKGWGIFEEGGQAVLNFIKGIPAKIMSVFSGAGTMLMNAGRELMAGLAAGIAEKIGDAINAVKGGLSKIKGLLPGSPIKWGPLKNWNNGGAGKRLMGLVEQGVKKATPKTVAAAQTAFTKISDSLKKTRDDLRSTLDGLKSDFASLAESISGAFTGNLFDVSAIEMDREAGIGAKSVSQVFRDNLLGKKAELSGLLSSFRTLQGWGLNPAFLSQLFASGNGALITELAGMGQTGALDTASLFSEVTGLGDQLGNAVAMNDPISDRIDETNRLLTEAVTALNYLGSDIGKELNGAAAEAQRKKKKKRGRK